MVVTRLRRALGKANCVRTGAAGYLAEVEPDQLDLLRFRAHLAAGEHAAATALWRGPVLANVTSESLHRDAVPALVEERLTALERRIDADLAVGVAAELVPELRSLTDAPPVAGGVLGAADARVAPQWSAGGRARDLPRGGAGARRAARGRAGASAAGGATAGADRRHARAAATPGATPAADRVAALRRQGRRAGPAERTARFGAAAGDQRQRRDRQDRARRAVGASDRRPVPGRAALRGPAWVRPDRRARQPDRHGPRLPAGARRACGGDPDRHRGDAEAATAPCCPSGGCWCCSTTSGT